MEPSVSRVYPLRQQHPAHLDLVVNIVTGPAPNLLRELNDLRRKAWMHMRDHHSVGVEFHGPALLDAQDDQVNCYHYLVTQRHSDKIIAAARLMTVPHINDMPEGQSFVPWLGKQAGPFGMLQRLVVDPAWHGHQVGKFLDRTRLEDAKRHRISWLMARAVGEKRALDLSERGFVTVDVESQFNSVGFDVQLPCFNMVKRL